MARSVRKASNYTYPDKDNWRTPNELFERYDQRYHFILDSAADHSNHKCDRYFGPGGAAEDALAVNWPLEEGNIWCNPPYSRGWQEKFLLKAVRERKRVSDLGGRSVFLLLADTSTSRFHDIIMPLATEVQFLRGRVKFIMTNGESVKNSPPFGSMIVVI